MRSTGGNRFIPAHSNESELNWAISEGIRDLANYARDTGRLIDPAAVSVETKRITDGRISVSVTGDLRDNPLTPRQSAVEAPSGDEQAEEAPGAVRGAGSVSGGQACHCGNPLRWHDDLDEPDNPWTRGLCGHCDDVRCDAFPGACKTNSASGAREGGKA